MIVGSKEYNNVHSWVRNRLGRPKKACMISADHKSGQFSWANISREYKRDISDWITLCRSCHKLFDIRKLTVEELKDIFKKREALLLTL